MERSSTPPEPPPSLRCTTSSGEPSSAGRASLGRGAWPAASLPCEVGASGGARPESGEFSRENCDADVFLTDCAAGGPCGGAGEGRWAAGGSATSGTGGPLPCAACATPPCSNSDHTYAVYSPLRKTAVPTHSSLLIWRQAWGEVCAPPGPHGAATHGPVAKKAPSRVPPSRWAQNRRPHVAVRAARSLNARRSDSRRAPRQDRCNRRATAVHTPPA